MVRWDASAPINEEGAELPHLSALLVCSIRIARNALIDSRSGGFLGVNMNLRDIRRKLDVHNRSFYP